MKTKDIIVGQAYRHAQYTGIKYLGVGRAKNDKDAYNVLSGSKTLVVLNGNFAGRLVLKPRQVGDPVTRKKNTKFWDGFYVDNP